MLNNQISPRALAYKRVSTRNPAKRNVDNKQVKIAGRRAIKCQLTHPLFHRFIS
jgi:hypothetical protein